MFRFVAKALLLALGVTATAAAFEVKILEQVIETSTDNAPLPTSTPSALVARACNSCEARVLNVNAGTKFFIHGEGQVTLNKLREACGSKTAAIVITYEARTSVVRRIKAHCAS